MYVVRQLHFSSLEKWPSVGDFLCIPEVHFTLICQAICSRGSPKRAAYVLLGRADYVGSLIGLAVSSLVACQVLPCTDAAGCCLAEPGHEAADCRTLGVPQATAGSLMGGFRVSVTLGLLPTYWQVKSGLGVCARLLTGTAVSWNLAMGLRDT